MGILIYKMERQSVLPLVALILAAVLWSTAAENSIPGSLTAKAKSLPARTGTHKKAVVEHVASDARAPPAPSDDETDDCEPPCFGCHTEDSTGNPTCCCP